MAIGATPMAIGAAPIGWEKIKVSETHGYVLLVSKHSFVGSLKSYFKGAPSIQRLTNPF